MLAATQLVGFGAGGFAPYSTEYTTPGTSTISIPAGASTVTVECIGGGGGSYFAGDPNNIGSGGGAYSKKNTYSVAGLTGIYISVPAQSGTTGLDGSDAFAKENSSGGTTICLAKAGKGGALGGAGGAAASGTGDVKYSGGAGSTAADAAGGGAAGPSGAGGNASGTTPGTGGGSPAGDGGAAASDGNNYGGGAGSDDVNRRGAQGWIKLSWA